MVLFYLFAFAMGSALAVQPAVNRGLAVAFGGSSVLAAFASFLVGTLILFAASLYDGGLGRAFAVVPQQPLWRFAGGLLGVFFIFGSVFLVPRIGLAPMIALVIAGQVFTSLIMDNFGLIGLEVRPVSWPKLLGAAFVMGGMMLVLFGERLVLALRGS